MSITTLKRKTDGRYGLSGGQHGVGFRNVISSGIFSLNDPRRVEAQTGKVSLQTRMRGTGYRGHGTANSLTMGTIVRSSYQNDYDPYDKARVSRPKPVPECPIVQAAQVSPEEKVHNLTYEVLKKEWCNPSEPGTCTKSCHVRGRKGSKVGTITKKMTHSYQDVLTKRKQPLPPGKEHYPPRVSRNSTFTTVPGFSYEEFVDRKTCVLLAKDVYLMFSTVQSTVISFFNLFVPTEETLTKMANTAYVVLALVSMVSNPQTWLSLQHFTTIRTPTLNPIGSTLSLRGPITPAYTYPIQNENAIGYVYPVTEITKSIVNNVPTSIASVTIKKGGIYTLFCQITGPTTGAVPPICNLLIATQANTENNVIFSKRGESIQSHPSGVPFRLSIFTTFNLTDRTYYFTVRTNANYTLSSYSFIVVRTA